MKLTEQQIDRARKILIDKAQWHKQDVMQVLETADRIAFARMEESARAYADLITVSDYLLELR